MDAAMEDRSNSRKRRRTMESIRREHEGEQNSNSDKDQEVVDSSPHSSPLHKMPLRDPASFATFHQYVEWVRMLKEEMSERSRDLVADSKIPSQMVTDVKGSSAGEGKLLSHARYWSPPGASTAIVEMNKALALATTSSFAPATPELSSLLANALSGGC